MTNATINNFFGGNLEEEVMDEVVILPRGEYANGYNFELPQKLTTADFESIQFYVGHANKNFTVGEVEINKSELTGAVGKDWYCLARYENNNYAIGIRKVSETSMRVIGFGQSTLPEARVTHVVGLKRRIARVGLDELMSSMGLPNLVANCDLTDNPINQRGFDGNWANLAIGAYGYDQWIKVSNSHMGYVIEEGKYRPNAKHTMTVNDVVIKEFTSPASGHFVVAVPFANIGKFDIYAGRFKRPWHPVQDGTSLCQRFYQLGNASAERLTSVFSESVPFQARGLVTLTPPVRNIVTPTASNPEWFSVAQNAWSKEGTITLAMRGNDSLRVNLSVPNATATRYQCVIVKFGYVVDASIPWAELSSNVIIAI